LISCAWNVPNGIQLPNYSSICSAHFVNKDFTEMLSGISRKVPRLGYWWNWGVIAVPKYFTRVCERQVNTTSLIRYIIIWFTFITQYNFCLSTIQCRL
jgi:hypothetical protein